MNLQKRYHAVIPSTTYLTHGIHSYTARTIPHIARYFIERLSEKDSVVLDSFCGSGTILLEAKLLHRNSIGIDINPLAKLISEAKTTLPDITELDSAISLLKKYVRDNDAKAFVKFPNMDYWFSQKAQNELSRIRFGLEGIRNQVSENTYKFLLVCFSSIIRKSSFADRRMAKTYRSKRMLRKVADGWTSKPIELLTEALDRNFERAKALSAIYGDNSNYVKVFEGDARKTSSILAHNGIDSVDFIITSPPYINAQDYFRSYKLELWWSGLATPNEIKSLRKEAIGSENTSGADYDCIPKSDNKLLNVVLNKIWKKNENLSKERIRVARQKAYIIHNFFENMKSVFKEFNEVLNPDGSFCLISGNNNICETQIQTYRILAQLAEKSGFELVEINRDEIRNRALPPGRNHNAGIIKEEWITVFRRRK